MNHARLELCAIRILHQYYIMITLNNLNFNQETVMGCNIFGVTTAIRPNELRFLPTITSTNVNFEIIVTGKTICNGSDFYAFYLPFILNHDCGLFNTEGLAPRPLVEGDLFPGKGVDPKTNISWEFPIRIDGKNVLFLEHMEPIYKDNMVYNRKSGIWIMFNHNGGFSKLCCAQNISMNSIVDPTQSTKFIYSMVDQID